MPKKFPLDDSPIFSESPQKASPLSARNKVVLIKRFKRSLHFSLSLLINFNKIPDKDLSFFILEISDFH